MKRRGNFSFLFIGILCLMSTSYFVNLGSSYELDQEEEVIVYALPFDQNMFSVYESDSYTTQPWFGAVYGYLVKRSSVQNRGWSTDLAKSMPTVSEDGLTFTFELQEGLHSSDGNLITSEDIEFSLKVALSPEINEAGYGKFSGLIDDGSYSQISERSFSITFSEQYVFPYDILSFPIIPDETYDEKYQNCLSGVVGDCSWNNNEGFDAISTGPYKITNIDTLNDIITLQANPYYHDALEVKTDKIIFKTIHDRNDLLSQLEQDSVHIADKNYFRGSGLSNNDGTITFVSVNAPVSEEIAINHKHPWIGTGEFIPNSVDQPTSNQLENARLLRKAMSHLVDRSGFTSNMGGVPATTIFPSVSLGWNPNLTPLSYDIEAAKTIMESLGFDYADLGEPDVNGNYESSFFGITILSPNIIPSINQWFTWYAETLPKIGIGVYQHVSTNLAQITPKTFGSEVNPPTYADGGYDIYFNSHQWQLDWNPENKFNGLGSCTEGTCQNFYNFDLDESITPLAQAIRDYLSELDFDLRLDAASYIQELLFDWQPSIPIGYPQSHWAWSSDVEGIDQLLISTFNQEWDKVYRTGFTPNNNTIDTEDLSSSTVEDGNDPSFIPLPIYWSLIALITALFVNKKKID